MFIYPLHLKPLECGYAWQSDQSDVRAIVRSLGITTAHLCYVSYVTAGIQGTCILLLHVCVSQ